ncbi:MAG: hypothetical protein WCI05_10595 [Myxococcales bacterium]
MRLAFFALFLSCAARTLPPPVVIETPPHIITPTEVVTEAELVQRGEGSLLRQRWADAKQAFETLLSAYPDGPNTARYLFDLALAYEGLEEREHARDRYLEVATRFAANPKARLALMRAATLQAYLEQWRPLGETAEAILRRGDLDDVDRIVALGARGLSRIELGDDMGANRDVLDGLDLAERKHFTSRDVLPVAAAQLRFALGEIRRVRSERITFDPLPEDFLTRLEQRATGLMSAQEAYADAVRSEDTHWATMAGYRVGEMYRALHHDLVAIPAPAQSKTDRQKQIFFAFMHVRYRVLLEKGLRQIEQTIALGERTNDRSAWVTRAREAKDEMVRVLESEKALIATFPFTEEEIREALKQLAKKVRR